MNVVGLDLSLTATGYATSVGSQTWKPKEVGAARLVAAHEWLVNLCFEAKPDLVLIEGYAFNSRNGGERLGELGGVARYALASNQVAFVEVAPKSVKKYATGKGNANKDAVGYAAVRRSGIEFLDNNAADAWWLRQMGLAKYAPTEAVQMPFAHRLALDAIAWPERSAL